MALADRVAAIFEKVFGIEPSEFRPGTGAGGRAALGLAGAHDPGDGPRGRVRRSLRSGRNHRDDFRSENHRSAPRKRGAGLTRNSTATWPGPSWPAEPRPLRRSSAAGRLSATANCGPRPPDGMRCCATRRAAVSALRLLAENSPLFVAGYLGIIRAGLCAVPFSGRLQRRGLPPHRRLDRHEAAGALRPVPRSCRTAGAARWASKSCSSRRRPGTPTLRRSRRPRSIRSAIWRPSCGPPARPARPRESW